MDEQPKDNWKYRRRVLWTVLGFCMGTVGYVLWKDLSSEPAEAAVTMGFGIIGASVASYVFGAVWDDKGKS